MRRHRIAGLCLLTLFAVFGAGCAGSSSQNIGADEFYGTLSIAGDSSGLATCHATWQVGGGGPSATYIELTGDDKVTCNDGSGERTMGKDSSLFGDISYSVGVADHPSTTYTITLYKAGVAYASTVVLPESMVITAPSDGATVTKKSALPITWTPGSGNSMSFGLSWTVGASLGTQTESESGDDGSHTSATTFTDTPGSNGVTVTGSGSGTLTLTRTKAGAFAASGLKGGSIEGSQARSILLSLVD